MTVERLRIILQRPPAINLELLALLSLSPAHVSLTFIPLSSITHIFFFPSWNDDQQTELSPRCVSFCCASHNMSLGHNHPMRFTPSTFNLDHPSISVLFLRRISRRVVLFKVFLHIP